MALVLNVPLIYFILLLDMRRVDLTFLTWIYLSCVFIGYYVLPLLFIVTIIFLFSFVFRRLAIIFIGTIITIYIYYLLIDSLAYNMTRIHINLFWLEWIFTDLAGFGLPPNTVRNVLLVLLVVIVVEVGVFMAARKLKKPKHLVLTFSLLTILAFGVSQVIHIVAYQKNDDRITSLTPYLPVYVPIISHKNAVKYGGLLPLGESKYDEASNKNQYGSLNYPLNEMKYNMSADKKLPNIVIIFLEGWRFDMMNEKVTPNIYALSKKSSVFLKHFSSGNSTIAGTFGFFYGIDPTYWTAVKANNVLIDNSVFIDALKNNHYTFVIYAKSNFERHKIKDAVFRGIKVHKSFAGKTKVEQDRDMTQQLISFVCKQKDSAHPFMAFAFYKSNHSPYMYPPEDSIFLPAKDLNLMFATDNTDPAYYLNDYRNATHYVDALIGEFLKQLDSLGDMENTLIIITTDHGEEFNDNRANYWGHGSNFTQFQTWVPLIFYVPDREPQQIEYTTSHIDIVPTILQKFFGCTNDIKDYSNGRNMFEKQMELRPFVIGSYVNYAFIIEDNVYEIYPLYTRKYKLNDIRAKASPPSPHLLKMIMEDINHFYNKNTNN